MSTEDDGWLTTIYTNSPHNSFNWAETLLLMEAPQLSDAIYTNGGPADWDPVAAPCLAVIQVSPRLDSTACPIATSSTQ